MLREFVTYIPGHGEFERETGGHEFPGSIFRDRDPLFSLFHLREWQGVLASVSPPGAPAFARIGKMIP